MGIVVHEFISLDGVFEDPRWTFDFPVDPRMFEDVGAAMQGSKGILLGRRTYEQFAPAWSTRTAEDDPGAPFFNESPKYVVSSTLKTEDLDWNNSSVLGPYDADAIRSLKDEVDGDIYVSGSGTLVRAMLTDGLVDKLLLLMFPVALGSGARLFPEGNTPTKLALADTDSYESGVVKLDYRSAA